MAIQVRADFTPSEFDLVRAALDAYKQKLELSAQEAEHPRDRQEARAVAIRVTDLLGKLR